MIEKLEMFMVLAREGHFGRAAVAYGVTQPTLSSAIRSLEESLGVQLVFRGARYQGLTPEGQQVLDHARRIVGEARALQDEMRQARHGVAGHLRIGVIPTALPRVARLTAPYLARNRAARVTVLSRSSAEIRDGIAAQELDAGITYLDGAGLGRVDEVGLWTERYRLVERGSDDAPLTWAEAAARPLCLLTPDMQNRHLINAHLAEAGAQVAPRVESNSTIALLSHVATGDWAAILAEALCEGFALPPGCVARPLTSPDAQHRVGLIVAHRPTHTPSLRALISEARRVAD
ncbi:LysR family transcriptional regulator [Paenirhodobacter sp. CAU 1674]|uniref:LysR family transcriptional regulator n=1 Tax=Paenirhodobacter sp. CAU 1674 TaxID=3032596 RepID=UPI0023DC5738|nr:LysR family transcriptional regulator [Paenirhodobacter sp. CAU 1674]MDF2141015.1 LysR family transcriptional regulator [Paenirhodobacter sp. CAU 1674]